MLKKLVIIVLILLVVGGYFVFAHNDCEPIDYDNKTMWDYFHSQGLYEIIDYKTQQPIKYPVGCEDGS